MLSPVQDTLVYLKLIFVSQPPCCQRGTDRDVVKVFKVSKGYFKDATKVFKRRQEYLTEFSLTDTDSIKIGVVSESV